MPVDATPHLQLASELAGMLTWELDLDKGTVRWSPDAERVLGRKPPASLASILACVHPDDREVARQQFNDLARGNNRIDITARIPDPARQRDRWFHCRGARFHDDATGCDRILGIAQDVTGYKQRELNVSFLAEMREHLAAAGTEDVLQVFGERTLTHLSLSRLTLSALSDEKDRLLVLHDQHLTGNPCEKIPGLTGSLLPDMKGALLGGQPVAIEDVDRDPLTAHMADEFHGCGVGSLLYVPYPATGQWHMLLGACKDSPYTWDTGEIVLLQDLAERLSLRFEHVRIVQELRQSEEQYRALFDSIDEGFCIIEILLDEAGVPTDYRFLETNPMFEQHTGLHNALGKTARELVPDLDEHWFEIYGKVALTGEPVRFVQHAAAMQQRWFDVNAFRIGDPGQRRVAILFKDISEQKRIEQTLRQSEERLRRAIEIETVGIIFFHPQGQVIDANEAFLRMSGYTRDDLEEGLLRLDTLTPPEWMPESRRAIDEFLSHGRIAPYEKEYLRKDGSRWWGLFAAARVGDNEGVKFIIDITASRQAEAERARLADIVDSSRDAIILCDPDGTIIDWNGAAEELYGYTSDEVIGQHIRLVVPPDRRHESRGAFERLVDGEQVPPWESVRTRKDGSTVYVEIRLSPIFGPQGKVVGASAIVRDISERRRLAQAQDDFLAMASHDLRSPVTVLLGRAQLMRRRKTYDEASIETIITQARRIERLAMDLQQVVQMESGQLQLNCSPVSLGTLAREAVDRVRSITDAFDFRVDVPEDPVTGNWDAHRLNQILDNLLGNAVKYSPDGGRIRIAVSENGESARIQVTDQGVGIPDSMQKMLFTRFYRADEAGVASGLGLGLYISRMLAEAHGGSISVDSAPGAGSTFIVDLPFAMPGRQA
ncbi:MAG TPA: PAS domain S-box protein [Thermomicrobiales bacterium]|nr:PAS domain S-box protein [Thermomicrobiales bacterium]